MILSSREIVKFVFFIALVAVVAFYVSSNREELMENLPLLSSGDEAPPGSGALPDQAGEEAQAGAPAGAGDASGTGGGDPAAEVSPGETVPVFSFAPEVLGGEGSLPVSPDLGGDFLTEFRLERERARSLQLDLLREVLDDPDIGGSARDQAMSLWLEITRSVTLETDIENLIRAKGFEDAVAVLSSGKATILIKAAALTEQEVVRIADIAVRVAGLSYEDITVMARGG